jgi:uncharacterized protein YprB with RNaseH-like and TPR domain
MAGASLQERLKRLRLERGAPPVQPPEPAQLPATEAETEDASGAERLRDLERAVVGETGDGLSLKQRLERLVAAAAARERRPRATPRPLEEMVAGRTVTNEHGEFFLAEQAYPLDQPHGDMPLVRLRSQAGAAVSILAGEPGFEAFDLSRAVYLDTETTGLAGGTGTAAFLIGVGFVRDEEFVVRQYFMRDFHEEPAVLHDLARELEGFSGIVTFNGKMFDLPLLESRFRLNRTRFPLASVAHFDLLFPARRLWKARLESCRLVHLEAQLLRVRRQEDVPGEQIPQIYFDYIRGGDALLLGRVFHHNRIDIVSLAALSALACEWVEGGLAEDPRDVLSLARVLERADEHERSLAEYRRALDASAGGDAVLVRRASLGRLAARAKAAGDLDAAVRYWEHAAEEGELAAFRELAVLHEHYRRDVRRALAAVEAGLARLARAFDAPLRLRHDLEHRRDRLERRLAARPEGETSSPDYS